MIDFGDAVNKNYQNDNGQKFYVVGNFIQQIRQKKRCHQWKNKNGQQLQSKIGKGVQVDYLVQCNKIEKDNTEYVWQTAFINNVFPLVRIEVFYGWNGHSTADYAEGEHIG